MEAFGTLNTAVLAIYLAGMLGIGLYFSRRQENAEMFFLGGRRLPWLAVAMSMYASLTSAVTYLGLPGTAYGENIALIIVCLMSPLVAPLILLLFYPLYHRLQITTSYEYIRRRFGRAAHYSVAGLFILARLGWLGTVIYAPAMAMSIATGLPLWSCICTMGLLATAYTTLGGLAAVVWTDVIQFIILVGGAIWVAISITQGVDGGAGQILSIAKESGRLHIADWKLDLFAMSGPIVAVSFFFQLMQDYGTDQVTVQRLMATGSLRSTVKSVIFNAGTDIVIISLLLFIGLGLYAFSLKHPMPEDLSADQIMPYYIIHYLPQGISGLLITAVFAAAMSSMDSGINSIATVLIKDFNLSSPASRLNEVAMARLLTIALGTTATLLAFYISTIGGIIKSFASFMSLFSAPVLALFLLGTLTRKGNFAGWLCGLIVSLAGTIWLQKVIQAHWVYYFPFSFALSFGISLIASRLIKTKPAPNELTVWNMKNRAGD
ncbi:MAG: sodium/solute symporter [Pontiellaceae bacterium]|nr:sodium/solute symporter [Pontiellaceae bacterium]MBN2784191.1 sodium/solute symporter [Pontiellaceae bacterium]